MTKERSEEISNALLADKNHIRELFELDPEEAAKELAKKGYDFTGAELVEYGDLLTEAKQKLDNSDGELNEGQLDDVAGGGLVTTALLGVAVGYWIYHKW